MPTIEALAALSPGRRHPDPLLPALMLCVALMVFFPTGKLRKGNLARKLFLLLALLDGFIFLLSWTVGGLDNMTAVIMIPLNLLAMTWHDLRNHWLPWVKKFDQTRNNSKQ